MDCSEKIKFFFQEHWKSLGYLLFLIILCALICYTRACCNLTSKDLKKDPKIPDVIPYNLTVFVNQNETLSELEGIGYLRPTW